MKKTVTICLILFMICGCQQEQNTKRKPDAEIPEIKELMTLPDHPSEEDAVFIVANNGIYNENLWNDFLEKTKDGIETSLIIALYTIEGDVIYERVEYNGTDYTIYCDNSRDSFGIFTEIVEERKYIYDLDFLSKEEINGTTATFRNHYGFLSNTFYMNQDELLADFEKRKQGEDVDLVPVFGDSRLSAE
ncbi:MAG: DUF4362 domain-containing protein [Erysipelotrichaceae bacterium]|nr:DUF4362 domain-containing protein [Erysipelotrichaceae bacterium]